MASKTISPIIPIALVMVLVGAIIIGGLGPGKGIDDTVDCDKLPPELLGDHIECEKEVLPDVGEIAGTAFWQVKTFYADGTSDIDTLGEFELSTGAVFAESDKDIIGWDLMLKYDIPYPVSKVTIGNAKMEFDSEMDMIDTYFTNLNGENLVFNGINNPTISIDAMSDVNKPIVDKFCPVLSECTLTGDLKIRGDIEIWITDGKDEERVLRGTFPQIKTQLTVNERGLGNEIKPDWNHVCDFAGVYSDVPEGRYVNEWKVDQNNPQRAILVKISSTICFKLNYDCEKNEILLADGSCKKIVCDEGEIVSGAVCVPMRCNDGFYLTTEFYADAETAKGACIPNGWIPDIPSCKVGEVPVSSEWHKSLPVVWRCEPDARQPITPEFCESKGEAFENGRCVRVPDCGSGYATGIISSNPAIACSSAEQEECLSSGREWNWVLGVCNSPDPAEENPPICVDDCGWEFVPPNECDYIGCADPAVIVVVEDPGPIIEVFETEYPNVVISEPSVQIMEVISCQDQYCGEVTSTITSIKTIEEINEEASRALLWQKVLEEIEELKECEEVLGPERCGVSECVNCFGEKIVDVRSVSDDVQVEYAGNIPAVSGSSNDNTSNTTGYGLFAARFLV
jgi:hypothetical protein